MSPSYASPPATLRCSTDSALPFSCSCPLLMLKRSLLRQGAASPRSSIGSHFVGSNSRSLHLRLQRRNTRQNGRFASVERSAAACSFDDGGRHLVCPATGRWASSADSVNSRAVRHLGFAWRCRAAALSTVCRPLLQIHTMNAQPCVRRGVASVRRGLTCLPLTCLPVTDGNRPR